MIQGLGLEFFDAWGCSGLRELRFRIESLGMFRVCGLEHNPKYKQLLNPMCLQVRLSCQGCRASVPLNPKPKPKTVQGIFVLYGSRGSRSEVCRDVG